jgi:hypothetical protein
MALPKPRRACRQRPASLKPGRSTEPAMTAILAIALFIIAILAINRYEFGRFD